MSTVWLLETTPYDSDLLLDVSVYATRLEVEAAARAVWASGRAPTRTLMAVEEFAADCLAAYARGLRERGTR